MFQISVMELNARVMLTLSLPSLGLVTYLCFVQGTISDKGRTVTNHDRTKYMSFRMDFQHTVFSITNQCIQIDIFRESMAAHT